MTKIERQIGESFRAARRESTRGGWPSCSKCFDGEDLTDGYTPLRNHPNVKRYFCRACRYEFSDLTGSPLQGFDRPLALWAFLLLGGDPKGFMMNRGSSEPQALTKSGERFAGTMLAQVWRNSLEADGITAEHLLATLKRWVVQRRARSRHGRIAGSVKAVTR